MRVVPAGLPDDRIPVVLAAVVDSDADPQGEGGLAGSDILAAPEVMGADGNAEVGVEPVEGLLAPARGVALDLWVGMGELVGQAGVVVAVAGVQIATEAVGDGVGRPLLELVAADSGRGLQMGQ